MAKTFSGFKLEGKRKFQGLNISIENERGSLRRGTSEDGHEWQTFMHIQYGYIRLTEGVDGDHVDCYIGANPFSMYAFIIHQQDPKTKKYDEDKVMLGFNSTEDARKAYERQYDRPGYFQSMDTVDMVTFKDMLKKMYGMKLKPNADHITYGKIFKAKRLPVGTISRGRKKVAEGKWVPVPKKGTRAANVHSAQSIAESLAEAGRQVAERGKGYQSKMDKLPIGTDIGGYIHTDIDGDKFWIGKRGGFIGSQLLTELGASKIDAAIAQQAASRIKADLNMTFYSRYKGKWKQGDKYVDFVKANETILKAETDKLAKTSGMIADKKLRTKHYKDGLYKLGIEITTIWSSLKKLKDLGKPMNKALVPIMKQISRKGKTFSMRFWVSPLEAKKLREAKVEAMEVRETPTPTTQSRSTTFLMDRDEITDYAPDAKNAVDRAQAMQRAIYGGAKPTVEEMYLTAADELEWALKGEGETGKGWYSEKIRETRSTLIKVFPDLAADNEWKLFASILAMTSPRNPVATNMDNAVKIYAIYKEAGRIPLKQPSGKNWPGPRTYETLGDMQSRIDAEGVDAFVQWLEQGSTGKEIKKWNPSFKGINKEFYPNATRYGPKVGAFYNNLIGEFGLSTVDLWAARSWRRWSNNIQKVKNSQGSWSINEKVDSRADQKNIESMFKTLSAEFSLKVADVQAVLWYYEKRLYRQIGAESRQSEDIGFDEAAKRVYDSFT